MCITVAVKKDDGYAYAETIGELKALFPEIFFLGDEMEREDSYCLCGLDEIATSMANDMEVRRPDWDTERLIADYVFEPKES
jgi:hypothetical protein